MFVIKRRAMASVLAVAAITTVAAAPAPESAPPQIDHEMALSIGDSDTASGNAQAGINVNNYVADGYACSSDPQMYCETILVELTNPYEEENARKGRERANFTFTLTPINPASDYDLLIFESDEDGNLGTQIGNSGDVPIADHPESVETATTVITTSEDEETVWVAVQVVYWAALGGWDGEASFA